MDSASDIEDFNFDDDSIAKKKIPVPTLQVLAVLSVCRVIKNPFDTFKLRLENLELCEQM